MYMCNLPDAVLRTEVDFGLAIGTPYHDLVQLGVPQASYHTLQQGKSRSHEHCSNAVTGHMGTALMHVTGHMSTAPMQ